MFEGLLEEGRGRSKEGARLALDERSGGARARACEGLAASRLAVELAASKAFE
jgi:hypothetical protein